MAPAQPQFTRIADASTPVPGAPLGYSYYLFSTSNLQAPALRNGQVTFEGYSRAGTEFRQGVYRTNVSGLIRIADSTMPAPGGGPNFKWFSSFTVSGNNVAFVATHEDPGPYWVYSWRNGVLGAEITAQTPSRAAPGTSRPRCAPGLSRTPSRSSAGRRGRRASM